MDFQNLNPRKFDQHLDIHLLELVPETRKPANCLG